MITSNLKGRLGNQLFQIAAAESLAYDNNDTCVFPMTSKGSIPSNDEQSFYSKTIFSRLKYSNDFSWVKSNFHEHTFEYQKIQYSENLCIDGYFQSENYFIQNQEKIKELFSPTEFVKTKIEKYSNLMNDNFVAVHVRRGDYVNLSEYHTNLCESTAYYKNALQMMQNKKKVFFSDDIQWCKKKFGTDDNLFVENENDLIELYILSQIPNKVISNSTFSWWAAWLPKNETNVVAPKNWFGSKNSCLSTTTLFPKTWTLVE
jgi:hypothetical protein